MPNKPARYYKCYAKQFLLKGKTTPTRAFDNCFEDGHGDEVVMYLMGICALDTEENQNKVENIYQNGFQYGSPACDFVIKVEEAAKLKRAIQAMGEKMYTNWLAFYNQRKMEGN